MRKKEEVMKKFEAIYVYANQRYHEDTEGIVLSGACRKGAGIIFTA